MSILTSLGINETIFVQLVLFLLTYLVLHFVLFKPYYNALSERRKKTVGNTEFAETLYAQAKDLEEQYEVKAREVNTIYKSIFDSQRSEAMKEYDQMVSQARQEAKNQVENARIKIGDEMKKARQELGNEIPLVSAALVDQLLGKSVSA